MMPEYLKIARHPKDYDGKLLDAVRAERDELEAIVRALAVADSSYSLSRIHSRAVEWCEKHPVADDEAH